MIVVKIFQKFPTAQTKKERLTFLLIDAAHEAWTCCYMRLPVTTDANRVWIINFYLYIRRARDVWTGGARRTRTRNAVYIHTALLVS